MRQRDIDMKYNPQLGSWYNPLSWLGTSTPSSSSASPTLPPEMTAKGSDPFYTPPFVPSSGPQMGPPSPATTPQPTDSTVAVPTIPSDFLAPGMEEVANQQIADQAKIDSYRKTMMIMAGVFAVILIAMSRRKKNG